MGFLKTDFLTATPSFAIGAASAFNLAGSFYSFNRSSSPDEADRIALRQDAAMVGQDILAVLDSSETKKLIDGKREGRQSEGN